ncbi:MAG: lipid asymmetry maintenance protein MlaB [Steroidobacteraceae bacterium]
MTEASLSNAPLHLGSTSLRDVTAFQAELAGRLDDSGTVSINGSGVERIDTATLQLLAAFVRDLRADARPVEWTDCSVALRRAAHRLGLTSALDLAADLT